MSYHQIILLIIQVMQKIKSQKSVRWIYTALIIACATQFSAAREVLSVRFHDDQNTVCQGGMIDKKHSSIRLSSDQNKEKRFFEFDSYKDVLSIDIENDVVEFLNESFTLEFEFFMERLPIDGMFPNVDKSNIMIFEALTDSDEAVLSLQGNRQNRFTARFKTESNDAYSFESAWKHEPNYAITEIFRGKWYQAALVYDHNKKLFELYLDKERVGSVKTKGSLKNMMTLRFGGDPNKTHPFSAFIGGIRDVKLNTEVLYDTISSRKAEIKSRQKYLIESKNKYSKQLPQERPEWAKHHPRMLLTPSQIEVLKKELSTEEGLKLKNKLIQICNEMIDPDSPHYFAEMPAKGHQLIDIFKPVNLCLASLLTDDGKYAKHAGNVVAKMAESRSYHDVAHYLVQSAGAAKPVMAVALTYDWGYEYLPEEQRRKIRLYLFETAKGTYDFYTKKSGGSIPRADALFGWVANWMAMSNSTLGNASLAILGETSGKAVPWLDQAKFRAAQYGLFAVSEDGAFHEMPHYLGFGASPLIIFMEALNTAGGEDLLSRSGLLHTPNFIAYAMRPASPRELMSLKYMPSNGLSGLLEGYSFIMPLLRRKSQSQAAEWVWQQRNYDEDWYGYCNNLFSIIWYQPIDNSIDSPGLPLAKWFKTEGIAAFRSGWDADAIAGMLMAYPTKVMAHDQTDRGQFTLYGFQGRWIIDNGGRQLPKNSSREAHNLVTVDSGGPKFTARVGRNYHYDAFLNSYTHMPGLITAAEADLTPSYRYILGRRRDRVNEQDESGKENEFLYAKRSIIFLRDASNAPQYLLVHDKLKKDQKPHSYTVNFHTDPKNDVVVKPDNRNSLQLRQYSQSISRISFVSYQDDNEKNRKYYYKGSPEAGSVDYEIDIPRNGQYDLYGYGRAGKEKWFIPSAAQDSFFVDIAGRRMQWNTPDSSTYQWTKISKTPLRLKQGKAHLRLLLREPNTRVAKFALFPSGQNRIPIFEKPDQGGLILIDAAHPKKLGGGFVIGQEEVSIERPDAFLSLHQLYPGVGFNHDVFEGDLLNHYRITSTVESSSAQFLNFFYPRNGSMERPTIKSVSQGVSLVEWNDCQDTIYLDFGEGINEPGVKTDAELLVIRRVGTVVTFISMVGGSFLEIDGEPIVELAGGTGTMSWRGRSLVVSGENIYNFKFTIPEGSSYSNLETVNANGKTIDPIKVSKYWQSPNPFPSQNVLHW